jgi:hypothetical protein
MTRDMQETPHDEQMKDVALVIYYQVAKMLKAGRTPEQVEQALIRQGIKPETAHTMLIRVTESRLRVARRDGWRNLIFGFIICLLGIALVTGLFTGSAPKGASEIFSWIAIFVGGYWFVRGTLQYTSTGKPL